MEREEAKRLDSLRDRIRETMLQGGWWKLKDLEAVVGGSLTGISAKLRDLRKSKYGSYTVESRHLGGGLWEYHLIPPRSPAPVEAPSGAIVEETIGLNRSEAWGNAYDWLAYNSEPGWAERYWKRWDASIASARRRGYRIVRVRVVEANS